VIVRGRRVVNIIGHLTDNLYVAIEVTVGGKEFRMTSEDVVRKLRGVRPGRIHQHAVNIEGVYHPVKEAFAQVTGLDLLDFTTNTARTAFKRLGFDVVRMPAEQGR
jgi:hypothetical protein